MHTPFPEDAESEEYQQIQQLKESKAQEKVDAGDFKFEGAIFHIFKMPIHTEEDVNFCKIQIIAKADFGGANIGGNALFIGANIGGIADFGGANIGGSALFINAKIGRIAHFEGANIGKDADFSGANIMQDARFNLANIGGVAYFSGATIGGVTYFDDANIGGDASFYEVNIGGDADFGGANIGGDAWFNLANIGGDADFENASFSGEIEIIPIHIRSRISFKNTIFTNPKAQEEACRVAKNQCNKFGDNHEADYYFYREMEGKRKQKNEEILRWGEKFFVQWIFGYGVKPLRTFCIWFGVIFSFALLYYNFQALLSASSFIEYLYFSTTTAMTPGYGCYQIHPEWQWLALIEAFFGTFMWAAFIVIFARKYMR